MGINNPPIKCERIDKILTQFSENLYQDIFWSLPSTSPSKKDLIGFLFATVRFALDDLKISLVNSISSTTFYKTKMASIRKIFSLIGGKEKSY